MSSKASNNMHQQELQTLKEMKDESGTSSDEGGSSSSSSNSPTSHKKKRRRSGGKKKKFSSKDKRLPSNFAENVLELEMQIERDCSNIDNIN